MGIDLDALEAAMREATPGPWTISECDDLHAAGIHAAEEKHPFGTTSANEEARLIVAAVNALPGLIRELRELRADRERLDWLNAAFGGGKELVWLIELLIALVFAVLWICG